jgi:tripartite-type tricarboxylate transporter receptor subunit TctC
VSVASVFIFSLWSASAAHSAGVEDFYKKRNMPFIIGYSSGGGYDVYARLLARHMGQKIPGSPVLTPQNMPGAGSLKAASYLAEVAPKDGSVIGTFGRGIPLAPLIDNAKFDATKMTWIGSITEDVSLCLSWHTSKIQTWNDVLSKPYTVGGEGSTSDPDVFARLIKNVFHADIRLVTGYPGTKDIGLAMQRGEVDGLCGISYSTVKNGYRKQLAEKQINILVQAALKKDPDLPNVPLLIDQAKPDQLEVLKLMLAPQVMARPIAAPPNVPADRKAALRKAFDDTMKDKGFLADAKKLNLDVNPTGGVEIEKIVAELYATPKAVIEKAKHAIRD